MSSKTKIVVLHMKEIIYTVLFICLGILLVALLTFMFHPKNKETSSSKSTSYQPGIYTSQLTLGDKELEVEVTVDENHINSIRFSNLDDTVTTMYPLIQPTMEEIADQICQTQSLENISYSSDNPYTSQIIINAIDDAPKKSRNHQIVTAFSLLCSFLIICAASTSFPDILLHRILTFHNQISSVRNWNTSAASSSSSSDIP